MLKAPHTADRAGFEGIAVHDGGVQLQLTGRIEKTSLAYGLHRGIALYQTDSRLSGIHGVTAPAEDLLCRPGRLLGKIPGRNKTPHNAHLI